MHGRQRSSSSWRGRFLLCSRCSTTKTAIELRKTKARPIASALTIASPVVIQHLKHIFALALLIWVNPEARDWRPRLLHRGLRSLAHASRTDTSPSRREGGPCVVSGG